MYEWMDSHVFHNVSPEGLNLSAVRTEPCRSQFREMILILYGVPFEPKLDKYEIIKEIII